MLHTDSVNRPETGLQFFYSTFFTCVLLALGSYPRTQADLAFDPELYAFENCGHNILGVVICHPLPTSKAARCASSASNRLLGA